MGAASLVVHRVYMLPKEHLKASLVTEHLRASLVTEHLKASLLTVMQALVRRVAVIDPGTTAELTDCECKDFLSLKSFVINYSNSGVLAWGHSYTHPWECECC